MLGKFAFASVFIFDYFWSSEVFPTTLRSTLVGICSCFARIGSTLSPIIVDLVSTALTYSTHLYTYLLDLRCSIRIEMYLLIFRKPTFVLVFY